MKIGRRRGRVRIQLDYAESDVLAGYLEELADVFDDQDTPATDAVRSRLFPDGYKDDTEAAAEFRDLTENSLRETRIERIAVCRAELPEGGGDVEVDPEGVERWLSVINDMRLKLGVELEISEDWDGQIDPDSEQAEPQVVYQWLTMLQDSLVQTAMR